MAGVWVGEGVTKEERRAGANSNNHQIDKATIMETATHRMITNMGDCSAA